MDLTRRALGGSIEAVIADTANISSTTEVGGKNISAVIIGCIS